MFVQTNFELFFHKYNTVLVQSDSYVTKRQSIKLLGELLLDRANYSIMCAYVDSGDNLKLCMNLLRDDRKMVSYEGFHIFKVHSFAPQSAFPQYSPIHRFLLPTLINQQLCTESCTITKIEFYAFCQTFFTIGKKTISSMMKRHI